MSNKPMATSPGGESTQYESISTVTQPHAKQTGQMGSSSSVSKSVDPYGTTPSQNAAADAAAQGARTAGNIKYGQTISENQPAVAGGSGHVQSGYGGAPALSGSKEGMAEDGDEAANVRKVAGYGGGQDMDRGVGG